MRRDMTKKRKTEAGSATEVTEFLQRLKHGRKGEVQAIRELILSADPKISEHIKWNAPSFCIEGDDRITFRLQPSDRVQLVFHRGAKKRDDEATFSFKDNSGLLEWVTKDRAQVTFDDLDDVKAKRVALKNLVNRWMKATSPSRKA